jgi:MFS superfamily sulfate permease-like transporter
MTTARGFAAKNGYAIDVNQDMIALGVSDLASGFSRGFVVSGADSRTAVADSAGGKTQVTALIAAATMAAVLIFLTEPLAYLPTAVLAAILISSALGLFDVVSLRRYYSVSPPEFWLSVVATLGVMTVGVLPGVLIAVGLAVLKLLRMASRPHDVVLGLVREKGDVYSAVEEENGKTIPGLIIYRFESSLLFFNADHFKDRVRAIIKDANTRPRWFLFNAESVPVLDLTGADALEELHHELASQGIVLAVARSKGRFRMMLDRSGVTAKIGREHLFPTVHAGAEAFLAQGFGSAKSGNS